MPLCLAHAPVQITGKGAPKSQYRDLPSLDKLSLSPLGKWHVIFTVVLLLLILLLTLSVADLRGKQPVHLPPSTWLPACYHGAHML